MSSLELIVYGGGEIYREFFNAIALSMGSSGYESLIKLSLLVAGTWALVESITKRNLLINIKWLATYLLIFYMMFLPKATIHIFDRLEPGKPYAIDNVPLGLAIFASYTSRIGDGLTRLTEQYFTMPDYQPYNQTGMVMASRMVKAAGEFQITDPKFNQNLQSFVQQCVFYDLLLEKYSIHDLVNSSNIWQLISECASPARSFLYNRKITVCQDGARMLNQEWAGAIFDAETRYARKIFAKNPLAKQELLKRLPMSYAYLTKVTEAASAIMQQNLMANAIKHGLIDNPPGATLIRDFAFSKAQMQKRIANASIGEMAAHWLPIMKIVFECIMYGSFIFIFLLALFPFGGAIVRNYVYSLMWIQIWAPLYAIINLIISYYAQVKSGGVVTNGLTLTAMAGLSQINSDIAGMAGYISISVPFISTIVVKGMADGFTQLAQYIGGVTQSTALAVAPEMAAGNLSLDNTSFANHNAFNTSANHFDTSARMASGSISYQLPTGSTVSVMPDGAAVLDNRAAISSLGTSINLGNSLRTAASQMFESATSSMVSDVRAMVDHYSSGVRELYDLGKSSSHTTGSGNSNTMSESGGFTASSNKIAQIMHSFEKAHNLNATQTARLFGAVYADAHTSVKWGGKGSVINKIINLVSGTSGEIGVTGGIKGEASLSGEAIDAQLFSEAKRHAKDHNFSQLVDSSVKAIREHSHRTGSEQTNRLSDSISSSFDKGNTLRDEIMTNYQKSQAYREAATMSDERVASINQNANQQFINWLSNQHASNTQGKIGMYQAEQMRTQHPELYQNYVEKYLQQQTQAHIAAFEEKHMSETHIDNIETAHQYTKESIGSKEAITDRHNEYREQVKSRTNNIDVGQNLSSGNVEKDVDDVINLAHKQMNQAAMSINSEGKKIEKR